MLKKIQALLESHFTDSESSELSPERAIHLAAAGLMVEVMRADFDVDDAERSKIQELVRERFDLDATEAEAILAEAEATSEESSSLYPIVQTLVNTMSIEERGQIVELLWRVAFADGHLDKYEEASIRKVAELLYVPHPLFIQAKHRAQNPS
ncbi:MAG: TerB family tellurite resistance protein [Gammaproteobacteria bacterium]